MIEGDGTINPKCTVAVSYIGDFQGTYILGDTFLRTYIASFNYSDETITLGKNVNAPTKFEPSSGRTW